MSKDGIIYLRPGESQPTNVNLSPHYEIKATSSDTEGAYSALVAHMRQPIPLHLHEDAEESFYVLEGELELYLGGDFYECPVGTWVTLPKGIPHAPRPVSDVTPVVLAVQTPGGFEDLVESMMAHQNAGNRDFTNPEYLEAVARHGWKLIDGDFWTKVDLDRQQSA